nr:biotin--[acetyl-CoA-carboxylase] ligase [Brevibacterium yomogidense]
MHPAPVIHEWTSETSSTNDRLVALLESGVDVPDFAVVGTDHQTAGRGRLDRTWTVPPGRALTCSVPVRVPVGTPASALGWLPVVTGLAVRAALAEAGVDSQLKWPNDVLVDGRKICGILARVVAHDGGMTVVVGTGVNVALTAEDLSEGGVPEGAATSVLLEDGQVDRSALLGSLVGHLRRTVTAVFAEGSAFTDGTTAAEARAAIVTLGAAVRVHLPGGDELVGTAVDLDEHANLLVRPDGVTDPQDTVRVAAGDVVHVRPV